MSDYDNVPGRTPRPVMDRLLARIEVDENCCWIWTGHTSRGYGQIAIGSRTDNSRRKVPVHRVTYEHFIGPVPDELQLDHTCRNRACANPWHVEPVTGATNTLRGEGIAAVNARKTHCPEGHAYDEQNTYRTNGRRECLTCLRDRQATYRTKRRLTREHV